MQNAKKHLAEAGLKMGVTRPSDFARRLKVQNECPPQSPARTQETGQLCSNLKLLDDPMIEILDDAHSKSIQNTMTHDRRSCAKHDTRKKCVQGLDEWHAAIELTKGLDLDAADSEEKKRKSGSSEPNPPKKAQKLHKKSSHKRHKHCRKFQAASEANCWQNPKNKKKNDRWQEGHWRH